MTATAGKANAMPLTRELAQFARETTADVYTADGDAAVVSMVGRKDRRQAYLDGENVTGWHDLDTLEPSLGLLRLWDERNAS